MRAVEYCCLVLLALAAGCAPAAATGSAPTLQPATGLTGLQPYHTRTHTAAPDPAEATETPAGAATALPTAAPRTHTVAAGEELLAIALQYGLTLDVLAAANPGVDPNLLTVGTVLVIPLDPGGAVDETGEIEQQRLAAGVRLGPLDCWPVADGGVWCFVIAYNDSANLVESISADVHLLGAAGEVIAVQNVLALLNQVAPGGGAPLASYFAPPLPAEAQPYRGRAELTTALAYPGESASLPLEVHNFRSEVLVGSLAVEASGDLILAAGDAQASDVWVAAAAFNNEGRIIGVRRWENGMPLLNGQWLPFAVRVYSTGDPIDHAEVWVEAWP